MSKIKIVNLVIIIIGVIASLSASIYYTFSSNQDLARAVYGVLIPFIYIIPFVIKKTFKVEIDDTILTIFYLFTVFSASLGSAWNSYKFIPHYDSIMHFIFGGVGCTAGLLILSLYKNVQSEEVSFIILFMFFFSMCCGACWEIYEFTGDMLFNGVAQGENIIIDGISITDVTDTMKDLICNLIGAILFSVYYLIDFKYKKFLGKMNKGYKSLTI